MIKGFSKMSQSQKVEWLASELNDYELENSLDTFKLQDQSLQEVVNSISENCISNFHLPYSIAPNFIINDREYIIPMVIEESSVVAALSNSAKIWQSLGGFRAKVISQIKTGQVHFTSKVPSTILFEQFEKYKQEFLEDISPIDLSMKKRGGGVQDIYLKDYTEKLEHYYTLELEVDSCDAMGANYINTLLESLKISLTSKLDIDVIMCILSNNSPKCIVEVAVSCPVSDLVDRVAATSDFATRFKLAVDIAKVNIDRAVTHNKGILNGIDAVALATGNDFRAIEAAVHAYASRKGQYASLSDVVIENDQFTFSMRIPLSVGTVGGLTKVHPLAKKSLEILGEPSSSDLMCIMASVGLAQNFAALRTLVTEGIQAGHMKMHLNNIMQMLNVPDQSKVKVKKHFKDRTVSVSAVKKYLEVHENSY